MRLSTPCSRIRSSAAPTSSGSPLGLSSPRTRPATGPRAATPRPVDATRNCLRCLSMMLSSLLRDAMLSDGSYACKSLADLLPLDGQFGGLAGLDLDGAAFLVAGVGVPQPERVPAGRHPVDGLSDGLQN